MPGRRISILSVLLAGAAFAQAPDYFPLVAGGQWVYRGTGAQAKPVLVTEVARSAEFDGREYFLFRSSPGGEYWLRKDERGAVLALDPETKQESIWYDFQAAEGERYKTALPSACCDGATVVSRSAEYKGPVGEYNYAFAVEYSGGRELFLPWIGMIHRSQEGGGAAYDLIYSRVGATVVSQPELSFSLTLDRYVYEANPPKITARLTLRNTTGNPVDLTFPSGQSYDFVIRNANGDAVFRWSEGKAFTMAIRKEQFTGERNYVEALEPAKALAAGRYTLEGWLATSPRAFAASAPFEIR